MSKWKPAYGSGRKFQSQWTKQFPWMSMARDGSQKAQCNVCLQTMNMKLSALLNHSKSCGIVMARSDSESPTQCLAVVPQTPNTQELDDVDVLSANRVAADQHIADLTEYLVQFQRDNYLCDVKLVAKDGQLKAHGVVLAAKSPVLRTALSQSTRSTERVILMPWAEVHELKIAVHFIYTGNIIVPSRYAMPASLPRVISTLKELGLKLPTVSFKSTDKEASSDVVVVKVERSDDNATPAADSDIALVAVDDDESAAVDAAMSGSEDGVDDTEQDAHADDAASSTGEMPTVRRGRGRPRAVQSSLALPSLCDTCGKEFTNKTYLAQHLRTHTGEMPYRCALCDRQFRHKVNFERHQKMHTGEKPHVCEFCGAGFIQNVMLLDHRSRHHLESVDPANAPFPCRLCGERFLTTHRLRTHRATCHRRAKATVKRKLMPGGFEASVLVGGGGQVYECPTCGEQFSSKSSLALHQRRHVVKKPFECTVCNCAFDVEAELTAHMRRHMTSWPRTVRDDGVGGASFIKLEAGGGGGATAQSLYQCTVCGKQSKQLTHLKSHMLMHTGERPFKCDYCDKAYRSKFDLRLHCLRIHGAQLPTTRRSRDMDEFSGVVELVLCEN